MSDKKIPPSFDNVLDIIPYLAVHNMLGYCEILRDFVDWARERDNDAKDFKCVIDEAGELLAATGNKAYKAPIILRTAMRATK